MKKKILILAGVLAVVAVLVVVNAKRSSGQKGIPVTLGAVKTGAITGKVSGPGKVNPEALVDISAHLPGKITRLAVREGDPVTKGQLLLELDRAQYEARLESARANVAAMKSNIELARAQDEKAALDLKRAGDLHERGVSSDQDLDLARTSARVEEARMNSAAQNYEQALASQKAAQDDLDKCRYLSPMDGVVSRLNVEEGEIAITGTMNNPGTVLLSIADMSRMEVEAEIDETDVVDVRLGQKVKIKVDAIPDTSFVGNVTEIANTAVTRNRGTQEEVTNFTVKAVFTDKVEKLRPGMSATVEIETASRDAAVKAPIQAIVTRNVEKEQKALETNKAGKKGKGKPKGETAIAAETPAGDPADEEDEAADKRVDGVYIVDKEGRAEFVPVKTGISDDRFVEIQSGLAAGGKVVTGPYQTLRTLESGKRVMEKKDLKGDTKGKR
jgi:HlyD family secretion protein